MFFVGLVLSGSVFHRVGAATGKAQVPVFVLTLGTVSKVGVDDRSCMCCLSGMSIERKTYKVCLDERVW